MARSLLTICSAAIALTLPALGPDASAQTRSGTPGQAVDHFNEGASLYKRGEVALACRAFEQSYREDAAPGTLFNMAVCHEAEGFLADAYRELDLLARRAEAAGRTEQAATVRKREERLQPQLARIDLVHLAARRAEVTGISLDDAPVLPEDWGRPLYVTPKAHVLHFRYGDGTEHDEHTAVLVAGSTTAVAMDRPAPGASLVAAAPAPSTRRTAAYVTGGAGVALLAAGGVFGVLTIVAKHDADGTCPALGCPDHGKQQAAYDELSQARTDATLSTVGIVAGGAAVAAGLVLLLTGGHADARPAAWTFVPAGDTHGAGLRVEASF